MYKLKSIRFFLLVSEKEIFPLFILLIRPMLWKKLVTNWVNQFRKKSECSINYWNYWGGSGTKNSKNVKLIFNWNLVSRKVYFWSLYCSSVWVTITSCGIRGGVITCTYYVVNKKLNKKTKNNWKNILCTSDVIQKKVQ